MQQEPDTETHVLKTSDGTIITMIAYPCSKDITIDIAPGIPPVEKNTVQLSLNAAELHAFIENLFQQLSLIETPF